MNLNISPLSLSPSPSFFPLCLTFCHHCPRFLSVFHVFIYVRNTCIVAAWVKHETEMVEYWKIHKQWQKKGEKEWQMDVPNKNNKTYIDLVGRRLQTKKEVCYF